MAKGAFRLIPIGDDDIKKLPPDMPLDGFVYAVSRYVAKGKATPPEQVRYELGGRDKEPTRGIPAKANALLSALTGMSTEASDFLHLSEHRHGMSGLIDRLQGDLRQFTDLCEMARRDANATIGPGRNEDENTELVRDLAAALRKASKPVDAKTNGALVQAFGLAQSIARRLDASFSEAKDQPGTVKHALKQIGKE